MRLDKFIVSTGKLSRSEAGRAARSGRILVDGVPEKKADRTIDPEQNVITLDGELLTYRKFTYIVMNKPDGYISASDSGREKDPIVLTLLPDELQRIGLFPCGRLDKHTTGLILLTNDGPLSHRLLSPRHHVSKKYFYTSKFPLTREEIAEAVGVGDGLWYAILTSLFYKKSVSIAIAISIAALSLAVDVVSFENAHLSTSIFAPQNEQNLANSIGLP